MLQSMTRKPARCRLLQLESLEDRAVPAGGTLYGATRAGDLFTIDLSTGAGTLVGFLQSSTTEIEYDPLTGRAFSQFPGGFGAGQEFDINTGFPIGEPVFNGVSFTGLEYIGPTLYGTYFEIESQISGSALAVLDPSTGMIIPVGLTGVEQISGLAYDPATDTLYGIAGGPGPADLYVLDRTTGQATVIGNTGFQAGSLEIAPDGRLYAGGSGENSGEIYIIDPATGASTFLGFTGIGGEVFSVTGLALRADETRTTLTSSANPVAVGEPVTFTAVVEPVNTPSPPPPPPPPTSLLIPPKNFALIDPTGTVTFFDGSNVLGTVALVNGVATLQTSSLAAGAHSITAVYSGGPEYASSVSNAVLQQVLAPPVPPPPPPPPPPLAPVGVRVIGADAGGEPRVEVYDDTGALRLRFLAYDPSFRGGVRVAAGDVNGDGVEDVITAPGPGGAPHVRVFNGRDGSSLFSFFAFDPGWTGGLFVTTGDVCGDAAPDVIVGADAGGAPHVKAFDAETMAEFASFFAFSPGFTGGARVAAGDVNGDGADDIVTAAGPGSGPHVRIFDVTTGFEIASFYAFDPAFSGGVFVAVGDVNGDGGGDIVAGAGTFPHIAVFSGDLTPIASFFAAPAGGPAGIVPAIIPTGARVAVAEVSGGSAEEIVVGLGAGNPPIIRAFDALGGETGTFSVLDPLFLGGVFVA